MLVKDKEYGNHKEGAKMWDDKLQLEKLEGYSLKKIESWHENLDGIKQLKLIYSDGHKTAESTFSVYTEGIPSNVEHNFLELDGNEHISKIQGTCHTDGLLKLKIELQSNRSILIDTKIEASDATEFSIEIQKEAQIFGFFGEYTGNLISFGVYQKKTSNNSFDLGLANPAAVSSSEIESLATYSKGKYKIKAISLWSHGNSFYGLQFSYLTAFGDTVIGKKHSVHSIHTSKPQSIELDDDEFLEEISGTYDDTHITYLDFKTSHSKHLSFGQKDTASILQNFHFTSKVLEQLIVSRISYINETLVQICGFHLPTVSINKDRGSTFAEFEKKTATKFFRIDTGSENLPQTEDLTQSVALKSEPLYQNNFDMQTSTMKTLLFPLKKEVSKSVVMPSRKTLHFYHQASERHALEKDFERKDVFAFLLWFGIGVNITQIMVGVSTKPKTQGILISSIVLSVLTILVLLDGLRIIGMKSLRTYNRYGLLLVAVIFFSFAVMIASFIQNESVGLSFFSLVTTIFLFPVYMKKRRILKEIFLFDPQREQFLSTLDPNAENTNTYKTPSERMKELMETAESVSKRIEAKKDRPSISTNKLDLKLDIE